MFTVYLNLSLKKPQWVNTNDRHARWGLGKLKLYLNQVLHFSYIWLKIKQVYK